MLILRIKRKGYCGNYKKLNEEQQVQIEESQEWVSIPEYLNFYYDNVIKSTLGFVSPIIFEEICLWDTEAHRVVKNLMVLSPDMTFRHNKYRGQSRYFEVGLEVVKDEELWRVNDFDGWGRGEGVGIILQVLDQGELLEVRWPGGCCYEDPIQLKRPDLDLASWEHEEY